MLAVGGGGVEAQAVHSSALVRTAAVSEMAFMFISLLVTELSADAARLSVRGRCANVHKCR
jgi:hypothetical protein